MEANDLKNIWRSGVDKNIELYSKQQLHEITIKSARKSIRRTYPSVITLIILLIVLVEFTLRIVMGSSTPVVRMLELSLLLTLSICLVLLILSFKRIRKYELETPTKEWLYYRIKEVERKLNFHIKYYFLIYIMAMCVSLGYFFLFIWFSNISVNQWIVSLVALGITFNIFRIQKSTIKKLRNGLKELNELFKQFE